MEKMNRRVFCGTSFLALPLMGVFAGEKKNRVCSNIPDPIPDVLADEFAKTTFDTRAERINCQRMAFPAVCRVRQDF